MAKSAPDWESETVTEWMVVAVDAAETDGLYNTSETDLCPAVDAAETDGLYNTSETDLCPAVDAAETDCLYNTGETDLCPAVDAAETDGLYSTSETDLCPAVDAAETDGLYSTGETDLCLAVDAAETDGLYNTSETDLCPAVDAAETDSLYNTSETDLCPAVDAAETDGPAAAPRMTPAVCAPACSASGSLHPPYTGRASAATMSRNHYYDHGHNQGNRLWPGSWVTTRVMCYNQRHKERHEVEGAEGDVTDWNKWQQRIHSRPTLWGNMATEEVVIHIFSIDNGILAHLY